MSILRRVLLGNVFLSLLFLAGLSEACLVEWGLRAAGGAGMSLGTGAALAVGLTVANSVVLFVLRALSWEVRPIYWVSRAYVLLSLGALIAGPPLLALLILDVPLRWAGADGLADMAVIMGGALVSTVGFGSMLWGFVIGQRRLVVEDVSLPVARLPEAFHGLRIVHLTDFHIGRQLRAPRLRRFLDRANSLEPDLIVLTGDIFDFDPTFIEEGCHELAKLSAPLGVYAVLGNHDVYTGADAVSEGLRTLTQIRLLRNEWEWIERDGERFALLGVDDPGRGWTERDSQHPALDGLVREAPSVGPRILLAHRPSYFRHAARLGIDVVLSGHTHGGQISPPRPFTHHNISRFIAHWTRGLFEENGTLLYVSRGVGVAGPPVRLNCPREIAHLKLEPRT
jgi:predicted MPP superfamily phosphohydrolase